jgi:hypothetical protein
LPLDLKALWEERVGDDLFKERDRAYRVYQNYYDSRESDGSQSLTYRPYLIDDQNVATDDHKNLVNHARRVVNHFASMFARPPALWAVPFDGEPTSIELAGKMTSAIEQIMFESRTRSTQARQSKWLSVRGDAVWGADWEENGDEKARLMVRTFDPSWCYPSFSDQDLGGVEDMLITYKVAGRWAKDKFGVEVGRPGDQVRIFVYWDGRIRQTQIEDVHIKAQDMTHDLGFVPFRWCFAQGDGEMAQSDVREIPKLQDFFNENLLLAMDSIRRDVDPAYYGTGLKKSITPVAGEVADIPEGATINAFPTGGDPSMILGVMSALSGFIESGAGVSPISMTGQAQGSIVTGAAVRHQVEAAEQRAENRKEAIADAYAQTASMLLRILEKKFPEKSIVIKTKENARSAVSGKDVMGWSMCAAEYGGFLGLPVDQRVRIALEGLGRLWDAEMGIRIADLPGVTPQDMTRRLHNYQIDQAKTTAAAQQAAQPQGQPGGGQPGPPGPQRPTKPPQPNAAQLLGGGR